MNIIILLSFIYSSCRTPNIAKTLGVSKQRLGYNARNWIDVFCNHRIRDKSEELKKKNILIMYIRIDKNTSTG